MYFASSGTRKFILAFSIFIVYWIVFDYMKSFPNYRLQPVHIKDLYLAEKKWFGITLDGNRITLNEYWALHSTPWLNVLSGICYLTWIPVPLAFSIFLYFKNRRQFFYFSLTFFWVNLLGFCIYYLYPAAPPWYVGHYGFTFHAETHGNVAGLDRFDNYFHAGIFQSIYSKSSNVFAAMPSLHASYLLVVLYFGLKNKLGWVNVFFGLLMAGIWFSAVYNSHHYILDVLAGIAVGLTGIFTFKFVLLRNNRIYNLVEKYLSATT